LNLRSIAKPIYNLIRPYTPRKYISASGVAIKRGHLFDFSDEKEYKPEAIAAIEENVNEGDHVVEVATGHGIFSMVCAREGATVDTYEGAGRMVEKATGFHELVGAADAVTVHHAVVGEPRELYGSDLEASAVAPADLPGCDVLLLDCEGAELDIIRGVNPTPPTIIVETHPSHGAPTHAVERLLSNHGYKIASKTLMGPETHVLVGARLRAYSEVENGD